MFKLGWFVNGFSPKTWLGPWAGENKTEWSGADFWVDHARALERGGFDAFFMEDTAMLEDTYGGSLDFTLKWAEMAPKNDPMPLMPLLAQATKHIGLISTVSTIQYHPYMAARLGATLDHLTDGRIGFNVVTSVSHRVAQNYGYDEHFGHAERYAMAEEWMEAVSALWDSWEPGALVLDIDEPRFADHTKVHPVNFVGKYYRTRGPLNTVPGPQRRPVIAQAGASQPGRDLAAREADVMLGLVNSTNEMVAFREDMDRRLVAYGRKPEDLHILYMTHVYIGETELEAQTRFDRIQEKRFEPDEIEKRLWVMSYASGGEIDYSTFDLHAPVPQDIGNGETTTLRALVEQKEKTLYEVATGPSRFGFDFIGTADSIAEQMNDVMALTDGHDGFLLQGIEDELTRRSVAEIVDGLCPVLKRRGYIRTSYSGSTFRENLSLSN